MSKPGKSERPCQLYWHYDDTWQLLYVGISLSAAARLSEHRDKPWFAQIAHVKVKTFPTRAEALAAEKAAIQAEWPKHNKHHAGDLRKKPKRSASADSISLEEELRKCMASRRLTWREKVERRAKRAAEYKEAKERARAANERMLASGQWKSIPRWAKV